VGLKVEIDVDSVIATLEAVGRDATKEGFSAIKKGAKEVRDLARDYAPVDGGDLENAIVDQPIASENTVHVGIDPRATDELGRPVAGYGQTMHEFKAVGGGSLPRGLGLYGLGKRSQAKDAGRNIVGGKFLERAFNELKRKILKDTGLRVKRLIDRGVKGDGEGEE
jgi:hypothetical protein